MKDVRGDLWHYLEHSYAAPDARCITTNGYLNRGGELVMGKGCALEAKKRYPDLPARVGARVRETGNHAYVFDVGEPWQLVTFPVKPGGEVAGVPGYLQPASLALIEASAQRLVQMTDAFSWTSVLLPRPGVGAGGLLYEDVRPVLEQYLDDRFRVITFA